MKKWILTLSLLSLQLSLFSQSRLTENTLRLDSTEVGAPAGIEIMEWYAHRWEGMGFGGRVEENFGPPMGNSMVGTFRLDSEDGPVFYEILLITEEHNSLVYKVKHFNPDFTGWEEKEDFVSFRFVKKEGDRYYFDGMTLHRKDRMTHLYLAMKQKDGSYEEVMLEMKQMD